MPPITQNCSLRHHSSKDTPAGNVEGRQAGRQGKDKRMRLKRDDKAGSLELTREGGLTREIGRNREESDTFESEHLNR